MGKCWVFKDGGFRNLAKGEAEEKGRKTVFWWDIIWGKETGIGGRERRMVCLRVEMGDRLCWRIAYMLIWNVRVETEMGRWGDEVLELKLMFVFREDGQIERGGKWTETEQSPRKTKTSSAIINYIFI